MGVSNATAGVSKVSPVSCWVVERELLRHLWAMLTAPSDLTFCLSVLPGQFFFSTNAGARSFCRLLTFLPRDSMRKRGLCCGPVSVRPSVCLSRW